MLVMLLLEGRTMGARVPLTCFVSKFFFLPSTKTETRGSLVPLDSTPLMSRAREQRYRQHEFQVQNSANKTFGLRKAGGRHLKARFLTPQALESYLAQRPGTPGSPLR